MIYWLSACPQATQCLDGQLAGIGPVHSAELSRSWRPSHQAGRLPPSGNHMHRLIATDCQHECKRHQESQEADSRLFELQGCLAAVEPSLRAGLGPAKRCAGCPNTTQLGLNCHLQEVGRGLSSRVFALSTSSPCLFGFGSRRGSAALSLAGKDLRRK